jgi:thioredoxin reductase (NADPH)
VQVSYHSYLVNPACLTNITPGSGCIAALEAEKWLTEQEPDLENPLEQDGEVKKSQVNGVVPEYRSNPLL